jgi:cytoskeletal protein RodZ
MATDTPKYVSEAEREARHSALAEFSRDERRPAVLLLSALLIAVLFFAIGLLVGRWTAEPDSVPTASSSNPTISSSTSSAAGTTSQPTTETSTNNGAETSATATRGFALLIATYDTPEKAQQLIKTLQETGYTDIRMPTPRAGETHPRYSVIVGRFTRDEARDAVRRMRANNDPRLKNAKVIEDGGQ